MRSASCRTGGSSKARRARQPGTMSPGPSRPAIPCAAGSCFSVLKRRKTISRGHSRWRAIAAWSKVLRSGGRSSSSPRPSGSQAVSAMARRSGAWRERFRACAISGAGPGDGSRPAKYNDQARKVCAMTTIRLTAAQAMVRFLSAQRVEIDGREQRLFEGVFAIFGHGNVAGMGEALFASRDSLPTYRAHNEQAMAHAAIAFAKSSRRKRMMACTTSIGPGATNMVTAAAVAHVNRLPVLLIPGDVFANRRPDPVLQQVESFGDGTVSANDCFRPVSRYFDRITRPDQIVPALNRAITVLTDPADCGPVTLAFCQDVQTEAYDYPASFFEERVHRLRRVAPDPHEIEEAAEILRHAKKPFVVCGGGVLYSDAERELIDFCASRGIPIGETQAGKSATPA